MEQVTETQNNTGERWLDYCAIFANGNRGRKTSIVIEKEDVGEVIAQNTSFSTIDYDPAGKGDDLEISYGNPSTTFQPYCQWSSQVMAGAGREWKSCSVGDHRHRKQKDHPQIYLIGVKKHDIR